MGNEFQLSVVTVTFNAKEIIGPTIASIVSQTARKQFEYIIVDGNSTDGTLNTIKEAEKLGQIDKWISEPDQGIYDAMNKAIALAKGKWIIFMNAGDVFHSSSIVEKILSLIEKNPNSDLIYGNCNLRYPDGSEFIDHSLGIQALSHSMICSHQSLFSKKELLTQFPFDLRYSICADYHFLLNCYKNGKSFYQVDDVISMVQLETYTWAQIKNGLLQKWSAASEVLGKVRVWPRFAAKYLFLGLKHFLKKYLLLKRSQ